MPRIRRKYLNNKLSKIHYSLHSADIPHCITYTAKTPAVHVASNLLFEYLSQQGFCCKKLLNYGAWNSRSKRKKEAICVLLGHYAASYGNFFYRPFGTTYCSHLQRSRSFLTLEVGTDTLSRNVGKQDTTRRNTLEERRSHQHRGGSLKSKKEALNDKTRTENHLR